MSNQQSLPQWDALPIPEIVPTLTGIITRHRARVQELLAQKTFSWETLCEPLEALSDELHQYWALVNHLNAVQNTQALREAYNACLPILTEFQTEMSQNPQLYAAYQSIADSQEYATLPQAARAVIDHALRDFRLSGVSLPAAEKAQFAQCVMELATLTTKFEENVLDATQGWTYTVTEAARLSGIPEQAVLQARLTAEERQIEGWVWTLDIPQYLAVIMHADDRELRRVIHEAYVTRASDQGPMAGKWDNSETMVSILAKRLQAARLLGFTCYAEESLATKMVKKPEEVLSFLAQLVEAALPTARDEWEALQAFAKETCQLSHMSPWDVPYVAEKLRVARFAISDEDVRPYFAALAVLDGLFWVLAQLWGLRFVQLTDVVTWHPDVLCYAVYDQHDAFLSHVYMDLYARANKRGGAWMDECRGRRRLRTGEIQTPIAFISCNFTAPVGGKPALLSHDEVLTLFHECGHALQHMLTKVDCLGVSGINGIEWDAVELPSQFLENWAWQRPVLCRMGRHYETGEVFPDVLFDRLWAARNFQAALAMMRQIEFAVFDFELHMMSNDVNSSLVQQLLDDVRARVSVVPVVPFNRFQHSFSHIFAGGYAAGYYSYKWAEVMASDAFEAFEETALFDAATANRFRACILETGGSRPAGELFAEFRGRAPHIHALLRSLGIIGEMHA